MTKEPEKTEDEMDLKPGQEPLTPEEKEAFLARARSEGRDLTPEEINRIFEPSIEPTADMPVAEEVEEMEAATLDGSRRALLEADFFEGLDVSHRMPATRLVTGLIFDFDYTLAEPKRPVDELMEEGARNAEAYMRSTGMAFPDDFYTNIIEARRFALKKSDDEQEEHIADDAMSFLLQFFGYPASKMDPDVLRTAVDIFYAPEMTAWRLRPGADELLAKLRDSGYRLAMLANYPCDRVFQRIIDYLGIRPYFDLCLSSASVEFRKPDERFFQLALDRWDALPYETVVVGDSLLHDIQGGLDLGTLTVQVGGPTASQTAHDNARLSRKIQADAVVDALANVLPLIEEWA